MLDQNTDRMWYVIGAVIIGAAIILILNGTAPKLFASVADTFKAKTEDVTNVVDDIGNSAESKPPGEENQLTDGAVPLTRENLELSLADVELSNSNHVTYDAKNDVWTVDVNPPMKDTNWWSSGFRLKQGNVVIPYGMTLNVSYEIFIPEGVTGTYAADDVNTHPYDTRVPSWNNNDNDDVLKRTFNGHIGGRDGSHKIPLNDGQWNTVTFSISNSDARNTEKVALYAVTNFGVYHNADEPIEVQLRNIQGELVTY